MGSVTLSLVSLLSLAGIQGNFASNCTRVDVVVGDPLRLTCDAPSATVWIYRDGNRDERTVFRGDHLIHGVGSIHLEGNYTLYIDQAEIQHDGEYACIANEIEVNTYCVEVHVPPTLVLLAEGFNGSEIHVDEGGPGVTLRCSVEPPTRLEWLIDGQPAPAFESSTCSVTDLDTNETHTISILECDPAAIGDDNITCVTRWFNGRKEEAVQIRVFTYVSPEILFFYEDQEVTTGVLTVTDTDSHELACTARTARPPVDLVVEIDGNRLNDLKITRTESLYDASSSVTTYDTTADVPYSIVIGNGTVTCIAIGQYEQQNKQRTISVTLTTTATLHPPSEADDSASDNKEDFPILFLVSGAAGSLVLILAIVFTVTCIIVKKRGSTRRKIDDELTYMGDPGDTANMSAKIAESDIDSPASHITPDQTVSAYEFSLPRPESIPSPRRRGSDYVDPSSLSNPPRLDLPEIPPVHEPITDSYSFDEKAEAVYYSDLKDEGGLGKMFHPNELCILMSMKAGKVHNRWMGSIAAPNKLSKCVVISSVTEQILGTRQIQWDVYVKRVLELPETKSLTKTEGICIDGAKLQLVQEHLTCVTLESHIRSHGDRGDQDTFPALATSDIKTWTIGLLKGIEVVHSYGLLHPGLSTKKILFTSDKTPKLYDFCLKEYAPRKVMLVKEKMTCSRNQLAPEAILRNEYSSSSDMWSMAVVIWECMTGSPPFFMDASGSMDGSGQLFPEEWPSQHTDMRNGHLFDCWRDECSTRPSARQFRISFEQAEDLNTAPVKKDVLTMGEDITSPDLYVPMKG